jgi:hypothetical protein
MEHRWGNRREISKGVRLKLRDGRTGFGRLCNVSVTGAWIATRVPGKLLSYVEVKFLGVQEGRRVVARVAAIIVRIASQGFGVEWFDFAPVPVLTLLAAPHREHQQRSAGV